MKNNRKVMLVIEFTYNYKPLHKNPNKDNIIQSSKVIKNQRPTF